MQNQRIVYIDLTSENVEYEYISKELRKNYLGGGGINSKILYDSNAMYHDALSPENVLVFGAGCVVGTSILASNRCVISAKSPVTDMYGDSNIGGTFPVRMRKAGIDNIVILGKAKSPVYILIKADGSVEILPANDIWGLYTNKATDILVERHKKNSEVACIGTSGENLVRFANIIMSKNHAAGRMGMGCVMGSKNLKAIVIEANNRPLEAYDKEKYKQLRQHWLDACNRAMTTKLGKVYGTLFLMELNTRSKSLPAKNAMTGEDENSDEVMPDVFKVDHQVKKIACYGCPVGCSKKYEVKKGRFKGEKGERIEYGAAVSVGPYVGIYDWSSIIHLKLLCDYMGVDTIEMASSVGLILEASERGLLSDEVTRGRKFKFGDVDDVEYLMKLMDSREGIGNYIADGAYRAGKALNCSEYTFCISKSSTGLQSNKRLVRSLGYLTSTRGGDHLKSFAFTMQNGGYYIAKHIFNIKNAKKQLATTDKKGRVLWWHENYKNVVDAIGVCLFAIQGMPSLGAALYDEFADLMNYGYGLDMTEIDTLKASERIYQLQNSFNVNCGRTIDDYVWPTRKKEKDISEEYISATKIDCRDAEGMLPEYFAYRGLKNGIPTIEKFKELGMEEYIEKAQCVKSDKFKGIDEILKEVNIVIHLGLVDKVRVRISNFIMGKALELKSESSMKKIRKNKKEDEL